MKHTCEKCKFCTKDKKKRICKIKRNVLGNLLEVSKYDTCERFAVIEQCENCRNCLRQNKCIVFCKLRINKTVPYTALGSSCNRFSAR